MKGVFVMKLETQIEILNKYCYFSNIRSNYVNDKRCFIAVKIHDFSILI